MVWTILLMAAGAAGAFPPSTDVCGPCNADSMPLSFAVAGESWENSTPSVRDTAFLSSSREEGEEEQQSGPYLQELFLGMVIYPQEQGEWQLTWGYYDHVETNRDSQVFFEVEYGITDQLQIGLEVPVEFSTEEESFEGMRNLGVGLYWNFYNDPRTGRAYGIGFDCGLPVDAPAGESRTIAYEPFAVAYQDFSEFALNISAALEVQNPLTPGEPTETTGDLDFAIFRRIGCVTPILELGVEITSQEVPVRLAPGLYWNLCDEGVDFAISFPVGLNDDAPDFGVFLLAIVEIEGA
jgi:hypothetical protein